MESAMVKRTPAHTGQKAKRMAASGTALSEMAPCPYSHVPNAETIRAIEEVEQGIGLSRAFTSVDELFEELMRDA
ncbi:MAG: hypothetical protein IJ849_03820 [Selenomonadaceae bacterium]|nr:hypothetical protein [Selenomonadaceae bacterium]